ncbi:YbaB/EbfC family nucleoid-associated protein [Actinophytocola sp.]|uniref:YbaB/EbfC family nucleoid-associated protein n=1 Tax=Actinophytocola sp. TaxID=1872138 RepID=UPI002ED582D3
MAGIDRWAQGFADKARRYQAAQQQTERLRLTASSANGVVRVTVGADGNVTGLELNNKVRTMPPEDLAAQILDTMRRAQAGIADRVSEVMTAQLGDEDQQTRAELLGNLRSRFPRQEDEAEEEEETPPPPPPAGKPAAADDEDNSPW